MFFRKVVSKSGDKEYAYLKLIENYREGNKIKQRVLANLGSLEKISPEKASRLISGLARICGLDSAVESDPLVLGTNRVLESADVLAVRKIWNELNIGDILREEIISDKDGESLVFFVEDMVMKKIIDTGVCENVDEGRISAVMEMLCSVQFKLEKRIFARLKKYLNTPDFIACHFLTCRFQAVKLGQWDDLFENPPYNKKLFLLVTATTEGIPLGFRIVYVPDASTILALLKSIRQEFQVDHLVVTGTQKIISEREFNYLKNCCFKYLYAVEDGWEARAHPELKDYQKDLYYNAVITGNEKSLFCYSPEKAAQERFALETKIALLESELSALNELAENENIAAFLEDGEYAKYFNLSFLPNFLGVSYKLKKDYYQSQLARCGKYQLKTNCKELADEDMIAIYNTSLKMKKDFSIINFFELPLDSPAKKSCFKGYLVVCYLALLIEAFIEMLLKRRGLVMPAREAIEALAGIKITVNKLHNFEAISITERSVKQERILEILGMQKLHKEISFEKVKGGFHKY